MEPWYVVVTRDFYRENVKVHYNYESAEKEAKELQNTLPKGTVFAIFSILLETEVVEYTAGSQFVLK